MYTFLKKENDLVNLIWKDSLGLIYLVCFFKMYSRLGYTWVKFYAPQSLYFFVFIYYNFVLHKKKRVHIVFLFLSDASSIFVFFPILQVV